MFDNNISNYFDKCSHRYSSKKSNFIVRFFRAKELLTFNSLDLFTRSDKVVEIGPGVGRYSKEIIRTIVPDNLITVECSNKMVEQLSSNNINVISPEKINLITGYNVIFYGGSLEFIYQPAEYLDILCKNNHIEKVIIIHPYVNIFSILYFLYYKTKGITLNILNSKKIHALMINYNLKLDSVLRFKPMNKVYVYKKEIP